MNHDPVVPQRDLRFPAFLICVWLLVGTFLYLQWELTRPMPWPDMRDLVAAMKLRLPPCSAGSALLYEASTNSWKCQHLSDLQNPMRLDTQCVASSGTALSWNACAVGGTGVSSSAFTIMTRK